MPKGSLQGTTRRRRCRPVKKVPNVEMICGRKKSPEVNADQKQEMFPSPLNLLQRHRAPETLVCLLIAKDELIWCIFCFKWNDQNSKLLNSRKYVFFCCLNSVETVEMTVLKMCASTQSGSPPVTAQHLHWERHLQRPPSTTHIDKQTWPWPGKRLCGSWPQ